MVGAVSVHIGEGLQVVAVLVPVRLVSLQNDGVVGGEGGDDVRTAVSDGVGALAVQVALSSLVVLSAELAALGLVVGTAHRSEDAVAQHGGEVGGGLSQSVLNSVIVESLNTDLCEVSNFTGDVLVSVDDVSATCANQVLQAASGVHHMLHTGNEVVSLNVSNLTVLVVNPNSALTQLEGVLQAVSGDFVALSQSGLGLVLHIVLDQSVISLNQDLGVGSVGGCQNVPEGGISVKIEGSGVLQGVALVSQVLLDVSFVSTGANQLSPLSLHSSNVFCLDGLIGDQSVVETVGIVTEQDGSVGVGSDLGHGVVAALRSGGQENTCSQQLSLSDSHLGITHRLVAFLHSFLIVLVEFAQDVIVNCARQLVVVSDVCVGILEGIYSRTLSFIAGRSLVTSSQRQNHHNCQQQCENLLHYSFLLYKI